MACELIGAKLLAPFFGSSLYVWAAALALTLGGLTTGYFVGGRLSKKYNGSKRLLYWVLIIAGLLLVVMPYTSHLIMNETIMLSLEAGTVVSLLCFMFPPLAFMGMVSPIIINLLTQEASTAGNSAGNVYAISTLGGILYTFLMGFYIIPEFGLKYPAVFSGAFLAFFPFIALLRQGQLTAWGTPLLMVLLVWLSLSSSVQYNEDYQVQYQSEGILGQVKVVDHPAYGFTKDGQMGRGLIVNNTLQTFVAVSDNYKYSIWDWANYFPTAASIYPPGSKVLLLGLGGGTLVKQLRTLGFDIQAVEIDRRIYEVSVDYFNMPADTKVSIDDARHYLKTCQEKFDIIIYDTFLSESVPEHLLTLEGLQDALHLLKPDGMIMSNFYGFIEGRKGKAARSVYKTFLQSGLEVELLATPGEENSRNLIFLASRKEQDFTSTRFEASMFPPIENLYNFFLQPSAIDTANAFVLSDYQPRLTKLYAPAARSWKESYNKYYRDYFME